MSVIKKASKCKRDDFQDDAEEAMRFFDGPYDFLYESKNRPGNRYDYGTDEDGPPRPAFQMTFNKVAEAVQLFGPALYHRNPYRQLTPAKLPNIPVTDPNDPQVQALQQALQQSALQQGQRAEMLASLLQGYINYTPNELDLRGHSRQVIDETLIKGMGVWWTLPYRPPGSQITLIGSFYDSIDNLVIDPDMETIEGAKWCARKRCMPKWDVEKRFGLPRGTLRGNLESRNMQAQVEAEPETYADAHKRGDSNDLMTYWEVYSRMGMGHKLKVSHTERLSAKSDIYDRHFDKFGDHIFLAVCDEYPWPLNLPESAAQSLPMKESFLRVQWPTPFWADPTSPWPFTYAAFHKVPRKVWPMSHMKPALGEIKFLNWAFSFIAGKIKNTSRDFIAIQKSAGEDIKTQILSGRDLSLLEIEGSHGTISEIVSFLQHPNFNGDVYKVIEVMMSLLERRLGLNELMYGESKRQLRSASEAQIKGDQLRIRPDDMAETIEEAMTKVARKEAIASSWHLRAQDVAPILGRERAMLWEQYVHGSDINSIVLELDYRIEAGSIRKPNRNRDQENANNAVQVFAPFFTKYYEMTGDVEPINAIFAMYAKAYDMPAEKLQIKPPPPPQPDPAEQQKAQQEQMKMEAEREKLQMEMQQMILEQQAKMAELEAKLRNQERLQESKIEFERQKLLLEIEKVRMELAMDQQEHAQEMRQDQQEHEQEMEQARQQGAQQMELQKAQGDANVEATKKAAAAKQAAAKKAPAKKPAKKATKKAPKKKK